MGFLSKDNVQSILNEDYQKKMDDWAEKYPFAAYIIFGKDTEEQKLAYAEERFKT